MFSHGFPRLETPPPGSHFNRPWSPDRDDPIPPRGLFLTDSRNPVEHRAPSDASIEALDLADYARVLARTDNPHHDLSQDPPSLPAFRAYDNYPPSPPPIRPLASGDSLPSLIGPSISSSRSHNSSVRTPTPLRRPYSLPPPSSFPNHSAPVLPSHSNRTNTREGQGHRPDFPDSPTEIDIGNFPAFSRNWYGQRKPEYDPYPSFSNDRHKLGFFDPAFPSTDIRGFSGYSPPPAYPNFSAYGSRGSREADVLPWSAGHLASDPPLDAEVKQERVRMLEREFGKGKTPAFGEDVRPIGSVDSRGRLITQGPKKRLATRLIQVLLALLAGVSSIYAAAVSLHLCNAFGLSN